MNLGQQAPYTECIQVISYILAADRRWLYRINESIYPRVGSKGSDVPGSDPGGGGGGGGLTVMCGALLWQREGCH